MDDLYFMKLAYNQALLAYEHDEVPIGAIIVKDGQVISQSYNQKEKLNCVTAHAELLAIQEACQKLGSWHLDDCTLYSTLEPCIMCSGAIIQSRIKRVVLGAKTKRWNGLLYYVDNVEFNHTLKITDHIYEQECSELLSAYFKSKRTNK